MPIYDRLCLPCADDGDCGDLEIASCALVAGERRCTVGCDFGCPDDYVCDDVVGGCVPEGGSCSCGPGDTFSLACAIITDPDEDVRCPGQAMCTDGVLSECTAPDEVCDEDLRESCSVCADDCCPCGDGVCTVGEQCGVCPEDCCPSCGDGVLDVGEGCDDGNNVDGDGCSKGCSDEDGEATCGNGYLELGEVCDDGNTDAADGCGADCQLEYVCGDQECEKSMQARRKD